MGEVKNITSVNTEVELCGIKMDNPVMAASGTFGYGYEFAELYDINCLGSFSFKGTTLEPRFGNPTPRIAECEMGMINAIGLQNPGVDKVIEEELPKLSKCLHKKVMANIGGFSIEEYTEVAKRLDACDQIGWLELNISCPNVRHGGLAFGTDPDAAASVVSSVKKAVKKPVIVKLSPNVTDITAIAKACEICRGKRTFPDKHDAGHEDRPEDRKTCHSQRHGRIFGTGSVPGGSEDGISGIRGCGYTGGRYRRHQIGRRCDRDDAGRRHCSTDRGC